MVGEFLGERVVPGAAAVGGRAEFRGEAVQQRAGRRRDPLRGAGGGLLIPLRPNPVLHPLHAGLHGGEAAVEFADAQPARRGEPHADRVPLRQHGGLRGGLGGGVAAVGPGSRARTSPRSQSASGGVCRWR